jgi:hypothetical protein
LAQAGASKPQYYNYAIDCKKNVKLFRGLWIWLTARKRKPHAYNLEPRDLRFAFNSYEGLRIIYGDNPGLLPEQTPTVKLDPLVGAENIETPAWQVIFAPWDAAHKLRHLARS